MGTLRTERTVTRIITVIFGTPMVRRGNAIFAEDLCVDVLVRSDGVRFKIIDQNDFEVAVHRRWYSEREVIGARTGLNELKRLIEDRLFVDFLDSAYPFGPSTAPPARAMQRLSIESVPSFLTDQQTGRYVVEDPDERSRPFESVLP